MRPVELNRLSQRSDCLYVCVYMASGSSADFPFGKSVLIAYNSIVVSRRDGTDEPRTRIRRARAVQTRGTVGGVTAAAPGKNRFYLRLLFF